MFQDLAIQAILDADDIKYQQTRPRFAAAPGCVSPT